MVRQGDDYQRPHFEIPPVIQNQLNELTMTVGGLKHAVEHLTSNWLRQDEAATQGRQVVFAKIDDLRDGLHGLSTRVEQVEKEIKIVQPHITIFNEERLRDEGARRQGKAWWAWFMVAAGFFGWALHEFFSFVFHK